MIQLRPETQLAAAVGWLLCHLRLHVWQETRHGRRWRRRCYRCHMTRWTDR